MAHHSAHNSTLLNETIDTNALIRIQADRMVRLLSFAEWKKANQDRRTLAFFTLKLSHLTELRENFFIDHKTIVIAHEDLGDDYFKRSTAIVFEEKFDEIFGDIQDARDEKFPSTNNGGQSSFSAMSQTTQRISSVQLPHIPIPKFTGKPIDWPAFHDAFNRLVRQNSELNAIQRFHFLKTSLPDDRDVDIHQMPLTDANYATAWDLLVKRYNNPRVIFMHHMNTLYALPVLSKERSEDIKTMLNVANVCVNAFRRVEIPIDGCDHWIAHYLASKLSTVTHQAWEHHWGSKTEIPKFSDLETFLHNRLITIDAIENRNVAHSLQPVTSTKSSTEQRKPQTNRESNRLRQNSFLTTTKSSSTHNKSCQLCPETHLIRRCPKFIEKDCYERKAIVDQHRLCLNCLSSQHLVAQCPSQKNCLQCGQRHHTMLHFPTPSNVPKSSSTIANPIAQVNSNTNIHSHTTNLVSTVPSPKKVLLATALVPVVNIKTGKTIILRTLIDDCSEGTIISENAVNALGLTRTPMLTDVTAVGDVTTTINSSIVSFELRSNVNQTFSAVVDIAVVMNVVTSKLPSESIIPQDWPHIKDLVLADPTYYQTNKIDLLIGTEMLASILLPDTRLGSPQQPVARNTQFGWILQGCAGATNSTKTHSIRIRCHQTTMNLETLVRNFFDNEQVPEERMLTEEEKRFVDFFNQTCTRQPNGKYTVRLPRRTLWDPEDTIGRSKQIALNRFHQLERRLNKYPELKERYATGIREYFDLNQIVPAISTENQTCSVTPSNKPSVLSCVLPHHAVIREDSLTTQVRIVFDASAKTSNGKSLNDILLVGPTLQNELPSVILNWRMHAYVFIADIKKMYRCIDMHKDDIDFQRILWRDESGEIKEYCLTTVTFGTAAAPCLAISIMHRIADDEKKAYPLAEEVLKKEVYVDDVQTGSDSIASTLQKRDHVMNALASAGMELRKWASNAPEILQSIPVEHQSSATSLDFDSRETIKTLGMCWQPNGDQFKFKLKFEIPTTITKRSVLSTTARLFDPLGFITPVVVKAKMILKSIWNYKPSNRDNSSLDWDEELPAPIHVQWQQYVSDLPNIDQISVPRWLNYSHQEIQSIQLHTFCDGSTSAYAATVYLRLQYPDIVHTHLLIAKSKVTPTKPITIPRTELCAAELATRLASWVRKNLRVSTNTVSMHYWSDATIVLHWLHGDPNRLKTFVSNRVSKILQLTSPKQWKHVGTHDNPADCATRGLSPTELADFELWWKGPTWLSQPEEFWPQHSVNQVDLDDLNAEIKVAQIRVHVNISQNSILNLYSSSTKLVRIVAWIGRYTHNSRKVNRSNRIFGPLTVNELKESLLRIIRTVQIQSFAKEIHAIQSSEPLPAKCKIRGLTPFIDNEGVLRARGRLQRSNLSFQRKNPIILPQYHHFTNLIIKQSHHNSLHGGVQLTMAYLRQRFWITNARQVVRSQLKECIQCFRNKPIVSTQIMGDLPSQRVNPPQRAFLCTGVDYTGAIELKSSKYRGNTTYKGYIAVFICMATKAVHLEAVTGMTTEHFLMALHRFMGRRGLCHEIFSDNGTNFIGAEKIVGYQSFIEAINHDVVPKVAAQGIQWHFTPPHSPNFGGLWEANVKSTKYHLKRMINGNRLTYEDLSTVLVRIESCLNSRPLCPLSSDIDDLDVLTPGHFLIGDALLAPPEHPSKGITLSTNYIALQRMIQQFWSKWSSDWLSHLQMRPKWHNIQPNLELNDLVLIKDDRLPPNEWLLGRIVELHPGADQLVRVATLRTKNGSYKRSISKLCRLPINDNNRADELQH